MTKHLVARCAQKPTPAMRARLVFRVAAILARYPVIVIHRQRPAYSLGASADVAKSVLEFQQCVVLFGRHVMPNSKVMLAGGFTPPPRGLKLLTCATAALHLSHYAG